MLEKATDLLLRLSAFRRRLPAKPEGRGEGDRTKIVCEAYLSCRGGEVLVNINVISHPFDNNDDD